MVDRRWWVALVVAGALVGAGCGGDDGSGASSSGSDAAVADGCEETPLTMRLEATGATPLGAAEFEVTDAVVRRVPIVPGAEPTGDPDELAAQREEAVSTDLALFSLYLADYDIDQSELEGFGFGELTPDPGGTVGTITIVPTDPGGFAAGDVVTGDEEFGYETTTTFGVIGMTVATNDDRGPSSFSEVDGQVEIVQLDDDTMCLDIDVEMSDGGSVVAAAQGVVAAPIVRPADEFYFT